MSPELEMSLLERFPKLFRQIEMTSFDSCLGRGIECWDGWFDLIWECSKELEKIYPELEYGQIKQKLAALTIYVDYPEDKEYYDQINKILNKYYELSKKVCEGCGSAEDVDQRGTGYIITLCIPCHKKYLIHKWQAFPGA